QAMPVQYQQHWRALFGHRAECDREKRHAHRATMRLDHIKDSHRAPPMMEQTAPSNFKARCGWFQEPRALQCQAKLWQAMLCILKNRLTAPNLVVNPLASHRFQFRPAA